MVEYELADSGISQVLSQHHVDPAALFRRDATVLVKPVHGVLFLFFRKVSSEHILHQ